MSDRDELLAELEQKARAAGAAVDDLFDFISSVGAKGDPARTAALDQRAAQYRDKHPPERHRAFADQLLNEVIWTMMGARVGLGLNWAESFARVASLENMARWRARHAEG